LHQVQSVLHQAQFTLEHIILIVVVFLAVAAFLVVELLILTVVVEYIILEHTILTVAEYLIPAEHITLTVLAARSQNPPRYLAAESKHFQSNCSCPWSPWLRAN
jgi:hypothetical protein